MIEIPRAALTADEIKFKNEYESLNGTEYKEKGNIKVLFSKIIYKICSTRPC